MKKLFLITFALLMATGCTKIPTVSPSEKYRPTTTIPLKQMVLHIIFNLQ